MSQENEKRKRPSAGGEEGRRPKKRPQSPGHGGDRRVTDDAKKSQRPQRAQHIQRAKDVQHAGTAQKTVRHAQRSKDTQHTETAQKTVRHAQRSKDTQHAQHLKRKMQEDTELLRGERMSVYDNAERSGQEQQKSSEKKRNKSKKKSDNVKAQGGKKKHTVSNIILVVAILVFVISAVQLVRSLLPYFEGGAEYDDLKELVIRQEATGETEEKSAAAHFVVDFDQLKQINSDTVAWIRFDEPSVISYPVVQGKDNKKYLTATFQANDNKLGAIFEDFEGSPDFTDRNTFIYGHNLKIGGEMFSQLKNYEDQEFYKQYPYFYLYTPDGKVRTYQIFSAGVVKDVADNYRKTYTSDEDFASYIQLCKKSSLYDTGVSVESDDKIVSLSTCTNVKEDERFLVQGVLIREETVEE